MKLCNITEEEEGKLYYELKKLYSGSRICQLWVEAEGFRVYPSPGKRQCLSRDVAGRQGLLPDNDLLSQSP